MGIVPEGYRRIYSGWILYAILPLLLLISTGCRDESSEMIGKSDLIPLAIEVTIEGTKQSETRAATGTDDQWSYTGFEDRDKMGFYASGGNWLDNTNKYFENFELEFKGGIQFVDPNGGSVFSPSDMAGNEVYMYYPYSSAMNGAGMELRKEGETTNSPSGYRCIDYLSASSLTMEGKINGVEMALYGTIFHTFAELIIMRGPGFDNPKPGQERITAVINRECTNIRVDFDMSNGWSCNPQLYYYDGNQAKISKDNSRKWDAWKGDNFNITDDENNEGVEAWYVIIPTLGTGNSRTRVEYIELYDNDGNLQRVSSLKLAGFKEKRPTKYVDSGWRYPMEITMEEMVPTVNPYPISRWEENIDLTDERKRGIDDLFTFEKWVSDYNAYLADKDNQNKQSALSVYGDKIISGDDGSITWHFYLLADIDLSDYKPSPWLDKNEEEVTPTDNTVIIPQLYDILDGKSTVLSGGKFLNYKLTGLNKTFVRSVNGGTLQNIDFIEPEIINLTSTEAAGILSLTLNNGFVINCNIIKGELLNPKGVAGMVTGTIIGSSVIRNCNIDGSLVRKSTGSDQFNGEALLYGEIISGRPDIDKNTISVVVEYE